MADNDRIVRAILAAGALNALVGAGYDKKLGAAAERPTVLKTVVELVNDLEAALFPREDPPKRGKGERR